MITAAGLAITGLHVQIAGAQILNGVDISMERGIGVIVGRNGMGKTTLCDAVMGFRPSTAGSITLDGVLLTGKQPHQVARQGVAYVPQGRRLFRSLTVYEHMRIAYRAGRRRVGPWTIDSLYELFPNLRDAQSRKAQQLSGGEQQMLAISRALLTQPRLVILDEPSEGLAPIVVEKIIETLQRLAQEQAQALLVIEQNLNVATALSDELWVMSTGQIVDRVRSADLLADQDLQRRYLGVR